MTAIIAFSRTGCRTAEKVAALTGEAALYAPERLAQPPFLPIEKPFADFYGRLFRSHSALIFVGSVGIAVREIAPHLRSKATDPAVISLDELGRFVIPILSGHIGGANALAARLAQGLGATPVITTATDIQHRFSVDAWAARNGYQISSLAAAKAVSAAILEGDVPICADFPLPEILPPGTCPGRTGPIGIYIGYRRDNPFDQTLHLLPKVLHLGIGCRRGISKEAVARAVTTVLEEQGIYPAAIGCAASIDLKAREPGLLDYCREMGLPIRFYPAQTLQAVPGCFPASEFVKSVTGVDNVCQRAALVGAEKTIVEKCAIDGVTVSLAVEKVEVSFE